MKLVVISFIAPLGATIELEKWRMLEGVYAESNNNRLLIAAMPENPVWQNLANAYPDLDKSQTTFEVGRTYTADQTSALNMAIGAEWGGNGAYRTMSIKTHPLRQYAPWDDVNKGMCFNVSMDGNGEPLFELIHRKGV